MNKSVVAITISLLAVLAVAAFVLTAREPQQGKAAGVSPTAHFDQSAAIEDRIRALEAAVAEERNARQLLEDELQNLYAEIDQLNGEKDAARVRDEQLVAANRVDNSQIQETRQQRAERATQRQVTRLVNAGSLFLGFILWPVVAIWAHMKPVQGDAAKLAAIEERLASLEASTSDRESTS